eukprot:9498640-Lingulodinium_polyedra.AAC.1
MVQVFADRVFRLIPLVRNQFLVVLVPCSIELRFHPTRTVNSVPGSVWRRCWHLAHQAVVVKHHFRSMGTRTRDRAPRALSRTR